MYLEILVGWYVSNLPAKENKQIIVGQNKSKTKTNLLNAEENIKDGQNTGEDDWLDT